VLLRACLRRNRRPQANQFAVSLPGQFDLVAVYFVLTVISAADQAEVLLKGGNDPARETHSFKTFDKLPFEFLRLFAIIINV
jgi:hypothetical protein